MGKTTLIGVIVFIVIVATVFSTLYVRSKRLPEVITEKVAESQARSLGKFALEYAIKEISNGSIELGETTLTLNYDNFSFQGGYIDNIIYKFDPEHHSVQIQANVHTTVDGEAVKHRSEASIEVVDTKLGDLDFSAAITTAGDVILKAKSEVNGGIIQGADFTIEEVFGVEGDVLKNAAERNGSYYLNPYNNDVVAESITWVDGNYKMTNHWSGTGIMIINGDLTITAQGSFEGIIFVFGSYSITAQVDILGAVFILDTGTTFLKAHSTITFDPDLASKWGNINLGDAAIRILSWLE